MTERDRVLTEVERYWREAGLSAEEVAEMRTELDQHLSDALVNGRTVEDVIGDEAASPRAGPPPGRGAPS